MDIPWGQAVQVGGIGFGLVFTVLTVLAIAIRLLGLVVGKIATGKGETSDRKEGS